MDLGYVGRSSHAESEKANLVWVCKQEADTIF